ncbi:MAG TPA: hypothetical protein VHX62_19575 [Solirubrobacteraceae bacterium]|nr:hypothetical protein [Solirubrobacteraceae bacterium]
MASLAWPGAALASGGHPANLTCTGVVTGGTYTSLTVPAGQSCDLTDATVLGNATVDSTASLDLGDKGLIGGNLLVGSQGGVFEDTGWVIDGTTTGEGAGTLSITGTVHNILVDQTGVLAVQSATVDGNIVSDRGVYGGEIGSSLIRGNVLVNATSAGNSGVASTWFIAGPQLNGDRQEIDGNLVLTANQSPMYVYYNHVHQNLVCYGNNPAPYNSVAGYANTVNGQSLGQCATANQPPTSADAQSALRAAAAPLAP